MGAGGSIAQLPDGSAPAPLQILVQPAPPKKTEASASRDVPRKLREARSLVEAKIWSEDEFAKEYEDHDTSHVRRGKVVTKSVFLYCTRVFR